MCDLNEEEFMKEKRLVIFFRGCYTVTKQTSKDENVRDGRLSDGRRHAEGLNGVVTQVNDSLRSKQALQTSLALWRLRHGNDSHRVPWHLPLWDWKAYFDQCNAL